MCCNSVSDRFRVPVGWDQHGDQLSARTAPKMGIPQAGLSHHVERPTKAEDLQEAGAAAQRSHNIHRFLVLRSLVSQSALPPLVYEQEDRLKEYMWSLGSVHFRPLAALKRSMKLLLCEKSFWNQSSLAAWIVPIRNFHIGSSWAAYVIAHLSNKTQSL
jgi:hypothetical protein